MKTRCDECQKRLRSTSSPWAFPLGDIRFDEDLRFCSEACIDAHRAKHEAAAYIGVGTMCTVERRLFHGGTVDHRWEIPIVRVTSKRAHFDGGSWFALSDPTREVKPRYLDYLTHVTALRPPASTSTTEARPR